jgi:hypothetical protein
MSGIEDWDDEDEMGVAAAFVLGFVIVFVSTAITGAAIIWNVASLAAETVRKVRS